MTWPGMEPTTSSTRGGRSTCTPPRWYVLSGYTPVHRSRRPVRQCLQWPSYTSVRLNNHLIPDKIDCKGHWWKKTNDAWLNDNYKSSEIMMDKPGFIISGHALLIVLFWFDAVFNMISVISRRNVTYS